MTFPPIRDRFRKAQPFPHVAVDGLFDPALVAAAAQQVPPMADARWLRSENRLDRTQPPKLSIRDLTPFPAIRELSDLMHSEQMRAWLGQAAGIGDLVPDPSLKGAGLHGNPRGGWLGTHRDFNAHEGLYRRVNAFVYLNPGWKPEWGGELELSDPDDPAATVRIAPTLGMFAAFECGEKSWHGHPEPLACPADRLRASIAAYFYTKEKPEWYQEEHSTIYLGRK
jgi:Rps23 Pro-64 3,4-dihydroxylase Tpa1-like proline 4-hydroxylase